MAAFEIAGAFNPKNPKNSFLAFKPLLDPMRSRAVKESGIPIAWTINGTFSDNEQMFQLDPRVDTGYTPERVLELAYSAGAALIAQHDTVTVHTTVVENDGTGNTSPFYTLARQQ